MDRRTKRGFTIVELLVALGIAAILLSLTYQIFVSQRRGYTVQEDVAEMQQNSRIAADELARLIKNIGNGVDLNLNNSQPQLLYAGPYELVFSGDLDLSSTTGPAADGTAIDSLFAGGTVHTVANPGFAGNAETYQVALVEESAGSRHYTLVRRTLAGNAWTDPEEIARNLNLEDAAGNAVFLFRYWGDFDLDGVEEWWDDPNPVAPPAGRTLDEVVRRVEISVVAETKNSDLRYSTNAGHRQAVVRSNVTPRNLNACPVINPVTPDATVTTAAVAGNIANYAFEVTLRGQPVDGQLVFFSLTRPAADGATALLTASGTTDANGRVTAQLQWALCPTLLAVLPPGPNPTADYTVTATLPATTTDLGFPCTPDSAQVVTTLTAGPAATVTVSRMPPDTQYTCPAPTFTFTAQAFDVCGVPVPPDPGLSFVSLDKDLNSFGTIDGGPSAAFAAGSPGFDTATMTQTFQVAPPTTGPYTALPDSDGNFLLKIQEDPASTWPPTITWNPDPIVYTLTPWPPKVLPDALWTGPITGPTPLGNCLDATAEDTFEVHDCLGNRVYQLETPPGYVVTAEVTPAAGGPPAPRQGKLYSNPDVPKLAADSPIDIYRSQTGLYQLGFALEECSLGLAGGSQYKPQVRLTLSGPGVDPSPPARDVTLQACLECDVAFTTAITECTQKTGVTLGKCNAKAGDTVTLQVHSGRVGGGGPGGDAVFASTGTATVAWTFPANATAETFELLIRSAQAGDEFWVTVYFDPANPTVAPVPDSTLEVCSSGPVEVTTQCQDLKIFKDSGFTQPVDNDMGDDCMVRITELWFEVEDCQVNTPVTLRNALTVYLVSGDGQYLDRERLDLTFGGSTTNQAPPNTVGRSTSRLLFQQNAVPTFDNGVLTYPRNKSVRIVAAYTDTSGNDPGDDHDPRLAAPVVAFPGETKCRKNVNLTAPVPVCFPNAITSGGGGGWNGNFQVHWGDVVIQGDVEIASTPKFLAKLPGGQFNGSPYVNNNTDRFVDIYVGKTAAGGGGRFLTNKGAIPPRDPSLPDRPFLEGEAGHDELKLKAGESYGNYYQNISAPKIREMISELDYDTMKTLAKDPARQAYWYAVSDTRIYNPDRNIEAEITTVLNRVTSNSLYNGKFIFIDAGKDLALDPNTTGATINDAPVDCGLAFNKRLPCFDIKLDAKFHTEGIIYIAGSINSTGGATAGGKDIAARSPPQYDFHYKHDQPPCVGVPLPNPCWTPTEDDLPLRSDPQYAQANFTIPDVNINGGLYVDGTIRFQGGPRIYGAVSAERGFLSGGTPEIWYNYDLNSSPEDTSLCVDCCTLRVQPADLILPSGASARLVGVGAAGGVIWTPEDPQVADAVKLSALEARVDAREMGIGRIKGVDGNNCPAWVEIVVVDLTLTPAAATVARGATVILRTNAPLGTPVSWSADSPGLVNIVPIGGSDPVSAAVTGLAEGVTVIQAQIGAHAPAEAIVTVTP